MWTMPHRHSVRHNNLHERPRRTGQHEQAHSVHAHVPFPTAHHTAPCWADVRQNPYLGDARSPTPSPPPFSPATMCGSPTRYASTTSGTERGGASTWLGFATANGTPRICHEAIWPVCPTCVFRVRCTWLGLRLGVRMRG